MLMLHQRHRDAAAARGARAIIVGACVLWGVQARSAQPTRVRVRADTITTRDSVLMRVVVNGDAIERMVRELLASKALEQTIGQALREASTGEKADARKVQGLRESLQEIARRNAGLITTIQMQCSNPQPHRDGYLGLVFGEAEITQRDNEPALYLLGSVVSVTPGSPAEKAGIRSGDVLLSIGGLDARKPIALGPILKPGALLPVRLQRGRAMKEVTVTVEKRPADYGSDCATVEQLIGPEHEAPFIMLRGPRIASAAPRAVAPGAPQIAGTVPPPPGAGGYSFSFAPMASAFFSSIAGATTMPLDDDSREALGVDNGILVTKVAPGSPAREAGLRGLDVIVAADDERINSLRALARIVGNARTGVVKLQIIRGGKSQVLTLRWQPSDR